MMAYTKGMKRWVAGVTLAAAAAAGAPGRAAGQQAVQLTTVTTVGAATSAAPRQVITYEEALRLAQQRNVALRQSENAAASDAVSVRQARSQLLPDLRFTTQGGQSYGRNFNQNDGAIVNTTTQTMNAGLSSSLTLFDGQKNLSNIRATQASQAASEQTVVRARQTAVFSVASNYVALVTQQEQLRVREEALAAQQDQEALVKAYVDAGKRPISDLYTQQAAVASARLDLTNARRALELARIDVMSTLQLDPAGEYEFVTPAIPQQATVAATPSLDSLITLAARQRSDLQALDSRLKAADASVQAATATRWPTLSLSLGYNTSFSSLSNFSFTDQLDQRRGGSIALGVSLPVFDRFTTSNASQQARIQADNARIALESQKREVGLQVRRAWLDLTSAREQLAAAEAQVKAADQALLTSRERYNAGAATLVELAQARATQVQAASAMVNARYNLVLQGTVMDYYTGGLAIPTS
ncbi:MAG: TolC family protein [Gemmatimonadaceae bacterium]